MPKGRWFVAYDARNTLRESRTDIRTKSGGVRILGRRPRELDGIKELREMPNPVGPCIYILFLNNKAQYVGQSVNPEFRLMFHVQAGMQFDRVFVVSCGIDHLDYLETAILARLLPPKNKRVGPWRPCDGIPNGVDRYELNFSSVNDVDRIGRSPPRRNIKK